MPPAKPLRGNETLVQLQDDLKQHRQRDVWEITDLLNLYFHSWVCKKLISSKHHVHYWFLAPFPHLVLHYKTSCSLMKEAGASLNGVIFYSHNSFVSMQRKKKAYSSHTFPLFDRWVFNSVASVFSWVIKSPPSINNSRKRVLVRARLHAANLSKVCGCRAGRFVSLISRLVLLQL